MIMVIPGSLPKGTVEKLVRGNIAYRNQHRRNQNRRRAAAGGAAVRAPPAQQNNAQLAANLMQQANAGVPNPVAQQMAPQVPHPQMQMQSAAQMQPGARPRNPHHQMRLHKCTSCNKDYKMRGLKARVTLACGGTFCRECVKNICHSTHNCPQCRAPLATRELAALQ